MDRGGVLLWLAGALLAGCAQAPPPPAAEPAAASAATAIEPPPPPSPMTLAERIRQEGWLVRFWEQLTPAQRRRVTLRLRQSWPAAVIDEAVAMPTWDSLGLPERETLIFGNGLPRAGQP